MIETKDAQSILNHSDCLLTAEQVEAAIKSMAGLVVAEYSDKNPLALCVMKGGAFTACALLQHLEFPLEFDFLQVMRYRNTTQGGNLEWRVKPSTDMAGRHVLIIDDIFDEGVTLREVVKYCQDHGAQSVKVAVLTRKLHNRSVEVPEVQYIALDVPDRYVFGCGMDYHGYFRNLNAIYAIKEES